MAATDCQKDELGSKSDGASDDDEIIRSTNVKSKDGQWHAMYLARSREGKKMLLRFELTKTPAAGQPTVHRRTFDLRELVGVRMAMDASSAAPVKLSGGVPLFSPNGLQATDNSLAIDELKPVICSPKPISISGATTLYLYFIARPGDNIWRVQPIIITFESSAECASWETVFQQECQQSHRPRALLVYVNPYGGRNKAMNIYRQKVAPIFALAGIHTHVVQTQRPNHAMDELRTMNPRCLYEFSGVISVGGDGTFNEVLCGAVIREQIDSGKDIADIDVDALVTPRLKLGIIPAGSSNSVVQSAQGSADVVTAALHIALGDDCGVDICTVHRGSDLMRISANAISYGWLGDLLKHSEDLRRLGPVRYQWSALRAILKHPSYGGRVAFRLSGVGSSSSAAHLNEKKRGELDLPPCADGCVICRSDKARETAGNDTDACTGDASVYPFHWQAEWNHIICCVIPCMSPFTPKGLAPFTALGDGSMDLTLITKITRTENVGFLRRVALRGGRDLKGDSRVKTFRVSRFSFTPTSLSDDESRELGVWNVDGEIIHQPADTLHFRLHTRLIRFFGREIEPKSMQTDVKRCFCSRRKAPSAIIRD
uniref:DAGKc domain-containing protein n=1 Tax=Plectus sambesii TaxID=2011161 RepID=A0A914WBR0_9BILA